MLAAQLDVLQDVVQQAVHHTVVLWTWLVHTCSNMRLFDPLQWSAAQCIVLFKCITAHVGMQVIAAMRSRSSMQALRAGVHFFPVAD
jgi:hypothetical protein